MLECRGCRVEISVRVRSKIITICRGADFLCPSFTNNSISWISFTDSASSSFLDTVDLPTLDQLAMTLFVQRRRQLEQVVQNSYGLEESKQSSTALRTTTVIDPYFVHDIKQLFVKMVYAYAFPKVLRRSHPTRLPYHHPIRLPQHPLEMEMKMLCLLITPKCVQKQAVDCSIIRTVGLTRR
ncbi:hypothetical protein TIFTF001_039335 [Ficus carica]|uniref:Uncharacterized protein n=1 Tax=Ficus carica TaxID=3494 RepID=A0AA88EEK0_FICCA|nr:hypothetical protein TIFTF001_039335 [Ficus carica]